MVKSDFVRKLDEIQGSVSSILKPLAFRKRGRTYNRKTAELIHVINFQMGNYPVGDYVIPGIRESCYGQLAINLGVLIPCVYTVERQQSVPAFCQDFNCTIRERVGTLSYGKDQWFDLTDDIKSLSAEVVRSINDVALPFLDQFTDFRSVLRFYYSRGVLPFQNHGRATLVAAIIEDQVNNRETAEKLFSQAVTTNHKGFSSHVFEIAKRLGYSIPENDEWRGGIM